MNTDIIAAKLLFDLDWQLRTGKLSVKTHVELVNQVNELKVAYEQSIDYYKCLVKSVTGVGSDSTDMPVITHRWTD